MTPTPHCASAADPRLVGDPVDTGSGAAVDQTIDFRLTGPLELRWVRHYDSSASGSRFALGWGHSHDYERWLVADVDGLRYIAPLGRVIGFPALAADGDEASSGGHRLRRVTPLRYEVHHHGEPSVEFEFWGIDLPARPRRLFRGRDEILFGYGPDGRWESILDSAGRYIWVTETDDGRIDALTLSGGIDGPHIPLVTYWYDERNNLIATRDSSGHGFTCLYDDANRMVQRVGRKGFSFHFRYGPDGRCVRSVGDGGMHDVSLDYDPSGRITRVMRADGGVWTYVFDEQGQLVRLLDPVGGVQTFVRGDQGRVETEVDPNGNATAWVYDAAGAPVAKVAPFERRTTLPEDPNAADWRAHRVAANPAEYELGALLDLNAITPPDAAQADALPVAADARKLLAVRPSAARGRQSLQAEPLGPRWWPRPRRGRLFNDLGKLVEQDDAWGNTRQWSYDASGNVVRYVDFDGAAWHYDCGTWHLRLAEANPLGATVNFAYHQSGMIAGCADAGGTVSEYVYDAKDQLVEIRRLGKVRDRYTRDAAGSLLAKHAGDGRPLLQIEVGPGNLPISRTLASGDVHTLEYDKFGRTVAAATTKARVEIAYDAFANRSADVRDGRGVEHTFAGWRVLDETVILGQFVVRYERRDDGALVVTDPAGGRQIIQPLSNGLVQRRLSNRSEELVQYDELGRCLLKFARRVTGGVWSRRYHWSGEGELRRVEDSRIGEVRHEYDAAHRLRRRVEPRGQVLEYDLDAADNLVRQPGLESVLVQPGNRLGAANGLRFAYDDRDHLAVRETPTGIVRYSYDSRDQLVRIDLPAGVWEAEYDALGRRTRKTWHGKTTEYFWSGDQLVAEQHADGRVRVYVYADPYALTPLAFLDYAAADAPPASGRRSLIFTDQVGAPQLIEDDAGAEVWLAYMEPYGRAWVTPRASVECHLRFPGHYLDPETGLHYNGFRYYDPALGRYLQSDPWGLPGGYNLYAYRTNPLLHVDVRGLGEENTSGQNGKKEDEESPVAPGAGAPEDEGPPPPPPPASDDEMWKAIFKQTRANGRGVTEAAIDPVTGQPVVRRSSPGPVDPPIVPYVRPDRPPEIADTDGGNQQGRCGMPRAVGSIAEENGGALPPGDPVRVSQGGLRYYAKDGQHADGTPRPAGYYYEATCEHCRGIMAGRPVGSDPAAPPLPQIVEPSAPPPGIPPNLPPGTQVPFTPPPGWEDG